MSNRKKISYGLVIAALIFFTIGLIFNMTIEYESLYSDFYLWNEFFSGFIGIGSGLVGISLIVNYGIKGLVSNAVKWANTLPLLLRILPYLAIFGFFIILYVVPVIAMKDMSMIILDIKDQDYEEVIGTVTNDIDEDFTEDANGFFSHQDRVIYFIPEGKTEDEEEFVVVKKLLPNWNYKDSKVKITRWKHSKLFISIDYAE